MKKVTVHASKSYDVYINNGLIDNSGNYVRAASDAKKAVIISDSNVGPLYADRVKNSLDSVGIQSVLFTLQAGEESKNPENLIAATEFCARFGLTRSDLIIALGGGVVTDLGGLCAAMYQRGIALVQVPTSLLAMVDSSVGGKTAVNLSCGKNMLGAFYQPSAVICDTDVLSTLPEAEFSNGCAEIIKYAVLRGGRLIELLYGDIKRDIEEVIYECVNIKAEYVFADEHDYGCRQFLNLGHTVGHAIERESGFYVAHGSAVAVGLCIIARACEQMGMCSGECVRETEQLCKRYSLPTDTDISPKQLMNSAQSDKKRDGDSVSLVLINGIGDCKIQKSDYDYLARCISLGTEKRL